MWSVSKELRHVMWSEGQFKGWDFAHIFRMVQKQKLFPKIFVDNMSNISPNVLIPNIPEYREISEKVMFFKAMLTNNDKEEHSMESGEELVISDGWADPVCGGPLLTNPLCEKSAIKAFVDMKVDFENGGGFYKIPITSGAGLCGWRCVQYYFYSGNGGDPELRERINEMMRTRCHDSD